MIPIFKQFAERVTSLRQNEFSRATWNLTAYYIGGVFLLLTISSVIILFLVPPDISRLSEHLLQNEGDATTTHQEFSVYELNEHLFEALIIVNTSILIIFMMSAYFFARKTLSPIEKMQKKQTQFMGDTAHELRTPLTVLKSGSESILRQSRTPDEYTLFIRESLEEIERMNKLTDELLFLLQQEHSSISKTFVQTNISTLLTHEIEKFIPYAYERHVTITHTVEQNMLAQIIPDDCIRLFKNLLKNAVDYNVPNGTITVTAHSSNNQIVCTVADTGIGIASSEIKHIFDRFYKVNTARTHTKHGGTGLGLAIVYEIVKNHHGSITVESTLGSGTVFFIHMPLHQ